MSSSLVPADLQSQILSMHYGKKIGIRTIARSLGLNRKTVRNIVQRKRVNLVRNSASRGSIVDPFKPAIEELLKADPQMPVPAILSRIREQGYLGGVSILKLCVAGLRQTPVRRREAFLSINASSAASF